MSNEVAPQSSSEGHDPAPSGAVLGGVTESRNLVTSKIEEAVRDLVRDAGYKVPKQKMCVWTTHPDKPGRLLPLTPDIVLIKHRLAIEVDPIGRGNRDHYANNHHGARPLDLKRNHLLEGAGWRVLRLRLGATNLEDAVGEGDVVCESSALTRAVTEAFLAALDDMVMRRPLTARFVPISTTAKPRKPAVRRSPVQRLAAYNYADDGHIFTWYPPTQSDDFKVHLRLAMNGRYLYTHDKPALFIREVGLHQVPAAEWKERLAAFLADMPPEPVGTTKYPWGETLLVAEAGNAEAMEVMYRCERKASLDVRTVEFTSNYEAMAAYNEQVIADANESVLLWLHPDAVAIGWRLTSFVRRRGGFGDYQVLTLDRTPTVPNPN